MKRPTESDGGMTEQEVVAIMKSSGSEAEWNANADRIKAACLGYPAFWYSAIFLSGLASQAKAKFAAASS